MSHIRIALADDHQMFTEGLSSILDNYEELRIIGIAQNGQLLLDLLHEKKADVVLLDVSMPVMRGEQAAITIMERYPETRIIMLTMHHTDDIVVPLIESGVHGFLLKNSSKKELVEAIRTVFQGGTYFSQEIASRLASRFRKNQARSIQLTKREQEVLQKVFEGLSTAEIAEKLFISPSTVETHRKNLLSKTGCKNSAQLIQFGLANSFISYKSS
jgi:DNA-binding NarL/FixJ family response regulator